MEKCTKCGGAILVFVKKGVIYRFCENYGDMEQHDFKVERIEEGVTAR